MKNITKSIFSRLMSPSFLVVIAGIFHGSNVNAVPLCFQSSTPTNNCKGTDLKRLGVDLIKISASVRDEFTTQVEHDESISLQYNEVLRKHENDGYISIKRRVVEALQYSADKKGWEQSESSLVVPIKSVRDNVVYRNAFQTVQGTSHRQYYLTVPNSPRYLIEMSSLEAKKVKSDGFVVYALKRIDGGKLSVNGRFYEATIKNPNEAFVETISIPYEVTDLMIVSGGRVVSRYNIILGESYSNYETQVRPKLAKLVENERSQFLEKLSTNATDENGNNAVHLAIWENRLHLLDSLDKSHEGLLMQRNKFGATPKDLANKNPHAMDKLKRLGLFDN